MDDDFPYIIGVGALHHVGQGEQPKGVRKKLGFHNPSRKPVYRVPAGSRKI